MTSGRGTRPGVTFTYSIKKSNRTGRETDELLISRKENSKTITRSTVEMAFENALEIQRTKRICKVDTKRTHSIEGVGLGLSICSQLLERMDSKLCVKSTYNEGSVFSFVLEQEVIDETPIGIFDLSENISEIKLKASDMSTAKKTLKSYASSIETNASLVKYYATTNANTMTGYTSTGSYNTNTNSGFTGII